MRLITIGIIAFLIVGLMYMGLSYYVGKKESKRGEEVSNETISYLSGQFQIMRVIGYSLDAVNINKIRIEVKNIGDWKNTSLFSIYIIDNFNRLREINNYITPKEYFEVSEVSYIDLPINLGYKESEYITIKIYYDGKLLISKKYKREALDVGENIFYPAE